MFALLWEPKAVRQRWVLLVQNLMLGVGCSMFALQVSAFILSAPDPRLVSIHFLALCSPP